MERQRVAQRQRRHEAQRVAEQDPVERTEVRQGRHIEEQRGAEQVQKGQDPLGREKPVGDQADEERRHHCRQRGGAVGHPGLRSGELERLQQIGAHGHVPCPPDEILEEHHH
jgi:hypothetical protein